MLPAVVVVAVGGCFDSVSGHDSQELLLLQGISNQSDPWADFGLIIIAAKVRMIFVIWE